MGRRTSKMLVCGLNESTGVELSGSVFISKGTGLLKCKICL